jgi:integrase
MPRLTKRFVDSLRPDPNGKDRTYWDESLRGFGLRVRPSGAGSWVIMYRTHEGRQRKLTLGRVGALTPDEARKEARQKLAEADKGGDPAGEKSAARKAMTVGALCDWYLEEAKGWVKPSTLDMDKSRVKCHVKPLIGNRAVTRITVTDLERMQADIAAGKTAKMKKRIGRGANTRGGRGVGARTLSMVGTILEFARRNGIIENNPARLAKKYPGQKRTRFFSFDEFAAFGAAMREAELAGDNSTGIAALKLLALTGCRRGEILSLPWEWFDAPNSCIRFGDTKTGAQIRPIGKSAAEYLQSLSRHENQKWVFPASTGEGYFVGIPRVFMRLCARANIEGATIHTLRHSFASAAAGLGYSELTIAGLLGHSLSGVTARYAHMPDKALLAAADIISMRILDALNGKGDAEIMEFPNNPNSQLEITP